MINWGDVAARLRAAAGVVGAWLWSWFWQILATFAVLALAFVLIRPFSEQRDPDAEDVAASWNDSIQRLGILSLYPPAEDFYVGDVWAVILQGDDGPRKQKPHVSTLVGKSFRVAYIDLRRDMQVAHQRQPVFSETMETEKRGSFRKVDPAEISNEIPADRIITTLTAFPGITITHRTRGTASLRWSIFGFGIGRQDQRIEEIRIPVAETYGVPPGAAFIRLDQWCKDSKTAIYCTDQYVRRLIAFSVSKEILAVKNGKYRTRIELRLVTRVFLTREIQHHRGFVAAGSASGQAGAANPAETPAKNETSTSNPPGSLDQRVSDALRGTQVPDAGALAGGIGGAILFSRGNEADIEINEVFQRPVAFGYRAISIALDPGAPQ